MELEILVLPNPDPIGVQVCDDDGAGTAAITTMVGVRFFAVN